MLTRIFNRLSDRNILLLFYCLLITQATLSFSQKSGTFDEPTRFAAGYMYLTRGDYRLNPEHPPLIKLMVGIPLLFLDLNLPPEIQEWHPAEQFGYSHQFLYQYNDADFLLFLGRLAVLPLSLLLGSFVFLWARQLFGREAAFFSLFLYTFEPNILAHTRLVNTDLGITCFIFLTIYGFYQLTHRVSLFSLCFTGLALGLALSAKFTALWSVPMLVLLGLGIVFSRNPLLVDCLKNRPIHITVIYKKLTLVLGILVVIGLLAYLTLWSFYGFRYETTATNDPSFQEFWDQSLPEQPVTRQAFTWAKELEVLPEAYLFGLSRVVTGTRRVAFLMGEFSEGWWYYFLVSFLVKTPLALLLLLALSLSLLPKLLRERPMVVWFLLVPVVLYFGIASMSQLNIGHRHLLPVYPFLFVLAGNLIPWSKTQKPFVKILLAGLAVWYLISSVSIFPHYLAYFNELAGGPKNGYKVLVDSNLDWGQDLKGLKRYMDEHGIERVWLSYFGTASPDYYGIAYNHLPSYYIFNAREEHVPTPFLAISATNLQGVHLPPALGIDRDYFRALRQKKPLAKIGYSIFIYKLEQ